MDFEYLTIETDNYYTTEWVTKVWRDSYMYYDLELIQVGDHNITEDLEFEVEPMEIVFRKKLVSFDANSLIKFVKPFGFLKDIIFVGEDHLKIIVENY